MSTKPELEPGSVVMLKSGSLPMTVRFLTGDEVSCVFQNPVSGLLVDVAIPRSMLQGASGVSMAELFKARAR